MGVEFIPDWAPLNTQYNEADREHNESRDQSSVPFGQGNGYYS